MQVHAFSVCDNPDYFYDYVQGLIDGLQAGISSRDLVDIKNVSVISLSLSLSLSFSPPQYIFSSPIIMQWIMSGKGAGVCYEHC